MVILNDGVLNKANLHKILRGYRSFVHPNGALLYNNGALLRNNGALFYRS